MGLFANGHSHERNPAPIRRIHGRRCTLRSGERDGVELIQAAAIQLGQAPLGCCIDDLSPVWGYGDGRSKGLTRAVKRWPSGSVITRRATALPGPLSTRHKFQLAAAAIASMSAVTAHGKNRHDADTCSIETSSTESETGIETTHFNSRIRSIAV